MNPFISVPSDCAIHDAGLVELEDGTQITRLPFWDTATAMFARLGHGPAEHMLGERGMRLPAVHDYEALHAIALHIDPYTLPSASMLRRDSVPQPWQNLDGSDSPAMAGYRASNMRSEHWCRQHDMEVFSRLDAAGWDGEPVANAGKHWANSGLIFGWWYELGGMIQTPSRFHASDPTYTDYATNFHAVMQDPGRDTAPDTDPAPRLAIPDIAVTIGERALYWLGYQSGLNPTEIPGPKHDPKILTYSKHCRRGGRFLGVDHDGSPLWLGGAPLPLARDEDPWCAALASSSLLHALQPGQTPPHGLRVSVREIVEDARVAETSRGVDYIPEPGDLAIYARGNGDPLLGGSGHVRCVVATFGDDYNGMGGNENDALVTAIHLLRSANSRGWVARSIAQPNS